MNILKVKGGNTDENGAVVLSAKLNIKALREFQKLQIKEQRGKKTFKCTPPGYPKEEVDNRKNRIVLSSNTNDLFDLDFDEQKNLSQLCIITFYRQYYLKP